MRIPGAVNNLMDSLERLPGIGPKTAARLTYYLLQAPKSLAVSFAQSLEALHEQTKICSVCKNIGEGDPCEICESPDRDRETICVVEKPLDILSLERSGKYHGLYHVLGGAISPLNNIGPEELYIDDLTKRLLKGGLKEVIIACNANLEGEATAMYLGKLIKQLDPNIKVTRIGRGLPVGSDLEYADDVTLTRALEGRSEI